MKKQMEQPTSPPAPASWVGSLPEWKIFYALVQLGYKPDVDFTYQSAWMGGRMAKGGVVLDFYLPDYSLAINVQGIYWHYKDTTMMVNAQIQRAQVEQLGITLIFIDEEHALANPTFYVKEALAGRDHSRMRKGV